MEKETTSPLDSRGRSSQLLAIVSIAPARVAKKKSCEGSQEEVGDARRRPFSSSKSQSASLRAWDLGAFEQAAVLTRQVLILTRPDGTLF